MSELLQRYQVSKYGVFDAETNVILTQYEIATQLNELATLQVQANGLAKALGHALAEWAIYADATRNIPITEGRDIEAKMYQKDDAVLESYREFQRAGKQRNIG